MASVGGPAQIIARFGSQTILCNPYAMTKLGVDKSHCFLKIDDYLILCVPYQLGFKKSLFLASLTLHEMAFFRKYIGGNVGLSISFIPKNSKSQEPVKFFIRCNLIGINPLKGRENTGLFDLDYKTTPDDLVSMFGGFLDNQEVVKAQYEEYGKSGIKMTPDIAKMLGYNMFASISEPNVEPKRIQVYLISSKNIEHLEAAGGKIRVPGSTVTYQLFFKKYRITVIGVIQSCSELPNKLIRTVAKLAFSPELVEIIDDYWYTTRSSQGMAAVTAVK
ncbi:MAG: hypothetical protein FWG99_04380 [Treponema sp.]|nr:hypothetical protein [Treponema sp.]